MLERTSDQISFIEMVKSFPNLSGYWDFDAWAIRKESIEDDFSALSSGEQVLLTFFVSVWFGRNENFDITRAAGVLSNDNKHIIIEWFLNPYWP